MLVVFSTFILSCFLFFFFFFFNDTATTEIYTLSLHDALPIFSEASARGCAYSFDLAMRGARVAKRHGLRSEEHTSELQSRLHLVCRLLLEKKKTEIRFHLIMAFVPLQLTNLTSARQLRISIHP